MPNVPGVWSYARWRTEQKEMAHGKTKEKANGAPAKKATLEDMTARFTKKREEREVDKLFRALVKLEGSDLHLKVGQPPMIRSRGSLQALNRGPIEVEEMVSLLLSLIHI